MSFEKISLRRFLWEDFFEKISFKKISFEKISFEKISYEKISFEEISFEKISLKKISFQKISFGKIFFRRLLYYNIFLGKGRFILLRRSWFFIEKILISNAALSVKPHKKGQALNDYSMVSFVASWLKWLQMTSVYSLDT